MQRSYTQLLYCYQPSVYIGMKLQIAVQLVTDSAMIFYLSTLCRILQNLK
jgi:hypothetical protein